MAKSTYSNTLHFLILTAILIVAGSTAYADTITDNFNDNSLDPKLWFASSSANEINQRLEMTGDAYAVPNYILGGDIVAEISFSYLDSQRPTRANMNFDPPGLSFNVGIHETSGYFIWPDFVSESTTDTQGRLRFTRSGSIYSGFYLDGAVWNPIGSPRDLGFTGDIWMVIEVSGDPSDVIAFDDFYLQADRLTPIPEPTSLLLLGTGLGALGLLAYRRKRK